MRYLIVDGHSVIFAWTDLRKLHQRRSILAREALVQRLTQYQDATGVRVVVVFDGKGAQTSEETEPGGVQIFYSNAGQTADEIIERLAAIYASTHELTVVTDDHLEQQTVNTFGALAISTESLSELLKTAHTQSKKDWAKYRRRD